MEFFIVLPEFYVIVNLSSNRTFSSSLDVSKIRIRGTNNK